MFVTVILIKVLLEIFVKVNTKSIKFLVKIKKKSNQMGLYDLTFLSICYTKNANLR